MKMRFVLIFLSLILGIALWKASRSLPDTGRGLTVQVAEAMPRSGVEHPVTAVLLNFRAYDTWLELGVLLMAVLGAAMIAGNGVTAAKAPEGPANPVLTALVRLVSPVIILSCGYLLWLGKFAVGGAFQAGVVLAAGAVLAVLAGHRLDLLISSALWKALLLGGFTAFLVLAIATQSSRQAVLEYPLQWAGNLILMVEFFATLSIGAALAALVIGLRFHDDGVQRRRDS